MKNRLPLVTPFILACVTFIVYAPSLYYAFQFDDLANIVKFYDIRNKTLGDLVFSNTRWISYWLNTLYYKLARFDPFYYRMGNILFHCTTGMLVFALVYLALSGLKKRSFFSDHAYQIATGTALLFLLHPVQTQTVSYVIQGQLEGLAGLFIIGTLLCFLLFSRAQSGAAKALSYVAMLTMAVLACGTKEIAIVTPALLLVIDWFFVAQGDIRSLMRRWWVHASIGVLVGGIYLYFLKPTYFMRVFGLAIQTRNNIGNVLTEDPHAQITSAWYFMSQFKVILHYLTIFIWPFSISVDYDWLLVRGFFAPDCLFPFLVLSTGFYALYRLLRAQPASLLGFGFVWFFVTILPRSSIIPSTELVADYKTYTASVGIYFLLAVGLCYAYTILSNFWLKKHAVLGRYAQVLVLVVAVAPLTAITVSRNTVWRSGEEFWLNVIHNAPNKARAYNNYGVSLSENGKFSEAVHYFKKAISMDTTYPDPCNNIAVAYSALGNIDDAITAMRKGIAIQPYYPEGYNNLASFLLQKKDYAQAEAALKTAIKLRPYYGKAFFNLGRLCLEQDRKMEAYEAFKACCTRADFDNDVGFGAYGNICLTLERAEEAAQAYEKALALNPREPSLRFSLANAYYMGKQYQQAQQEYERLLEVVPHDTRVVFNLAETHYSQQQFDKAAQLFKRVTVSSPEMIQAPLRLAACYVNTGQLKAAQELLTPLLNDQRVPENFKGTIKIALAQVADKMKTIRA